MILAQVNHDHRLQVIVRNLCGVVPDDMILRESVAVDRSRIVRGLHADPDAVAFLDFAIVAACVLYTLLHGNPVGDIDIRPMEQGIGFRDGPLGFDVDVELYPLLCPRYGGIKEQVIADIGIGLIAMFRLHALDKRRILVYGHLADLRLTDALFDFLAGHALEFKDAFLQDEGKNRLDGQDFLCLLVIGAYLLLYAFLWRQNHRIASFRKRFLLALYHIRRNEHYQAKNRKEILDLDCIVLYSLYEQGRGEYFWICSL